MAANEVQFVCVCVCVYITRGWINRARCEAKVEERGKMERGKYELRMAMEELCLLSSGDCEYQERQHQIGSSTMGLLCVSKQLLHVLS